MSDNPTEAEREMENAIFISADCWLKVFDLLPPSQLGLGIALISRRFDCFVDEHFKTRKWTLAQIRIQSKIGENGGTKEMKIFNANFDAPPIPQNPLPNKCMAFNGIVISFFDHNVLTFLGHFHRFFASSCATKLHIRSISNVRISAFVVHTIWPMLRHTIRLASFNPIAFRQLRQLAPSMLNDCPSIDFDIFYGGIFPAFPPDDSAMASDGQAVAKWLFTPRPDNVPRQLRCPVNARVVEQWASSVEQIKAAFSSASSPVNFVICVFFTSYLAQLSSAVVPFELINEFTGETLALLHQSANAFKLIRCPIAAYNEEETLANAMHDELFDGQKNNKIEIYLGHNGVDNGLLDDLPGPSSDQKKQK